MDKMRNIWEFAGRYKYLTTILAFAVIICFVDENNVISRVKYDREMRKLRSEIEKYRAEYEESTERLNELTTNPEAIERIAREKYLMKKHNEDIYVFDN